MMARKSKPPAPRAAVKPPSYPPGAFSAWGAGWTQDPATGEWKPPVHVLPDGSEVHGSSLGRNSSWRAGYVEGMADVLHLVRAKNTAQVNELFKIFAPLLDRVDAMKERIKTTSKSPLAAAILDGVALPEPDPITKAAYTKNFQRQLRDEGQAIELAALIRGGNTTEMAREKLGIGYVRAKRLRAIAVRLKLLEPQQRTRHTQPSK